MVTRSPERLTQAAGALVLIAGVAFHGPTLLGLPGFLVALFGGYIPLTLRGIEGVLLLLASLAILLLKVSLGLGLIRFEAGAWAPSIVVTGVDLLLMGYSFLRGLATLATPSDGVFGAPLLAAVIADGVVLVMLYWPSVWPALTRTYGRQSAGHRARAAYCMRIRDGWRTVGHGSGFTIVNVAPANFILAPFSWALAGLFYLVVVLPLKSWTVGQQP